MRNGKLLHDIPLNDKLLNRKLLNSKLLKDKPLNGKPPNRKVLNLLVSLKFFLYFLIKTRVSVTYSMYTVKVNWGETKGILALHTLCS